jgi:hypothetical protein
VSLQSSGLLEVIRLSVEWVAVLVAVVAAGVTTAGLVVSGFRRLADQVATGDQRLADQVAAGDQRLADRLAGVEQRVSFLAGLVEGKQRSALAPTQEAAE